MISRRVSWYRVAVASAASLAVALAGCDTVSRVRAVAASVAVVEEDTTGATQRQHRVADRGRSSAIRATRAPTTRAARPTPRRRPLQRRHRGLQQGGADRSQLRAGLHQPGARLPADQPQRRGATADFSGDPADPNYGPAYLGRANLLRAQGNYQEALTDLSQAIRLAPESAEAPPRARPRLPAQGHHEQAVLDFDAAIDRNPFVAAPYAARGQSLVAIGQYDKAIEDFNAALNVDNRNADAWARRGLALEKLNAAPRRLRAISARSRSTPTTPRPSRA